MRETRPLARFREWVIRLWGTVRPSRPDTELEQELRAHLDLAAEDERRRANSSEGAGRTAVVQLGAVAQSMDALRDQRGLPWLEDLARDARYGLRTLRRTPLFATVVLMTLAIGIGANTAVFSVVNSVLLKPLAYPSPEELVAVWHTAPGAPGLSTVSGDLRLSASMFFTYAENNRTFGDFGLWFAGSATVTGRTEPEEVRTLLVTDGTLQALGVQPVLGRWLARADQVPGAPRTVMIGHGYWQRAFGGDRSVVGRGLVVDSRPREIVGVLPEGFRVGAAHPDVILPLGFDRSRQSLPGFGFQAVARLKPGVTIAEASADVARMVPIWMGSWPAAPGVNPRIYESWRIAPALRPLKEDVIGNVASALWILMGTIGIVMVIACANVASLLLVRADGRQQELAVRAALGAGRGRIVRGLLSESVVLGLLGGMLGLGLAHTGLRFLVATGPATLPRLDEIALDSRALAFAFTVSLLSGLLFGLIPALKYAGPGLSLRLRGGGRTSSQSRERHRARNILVVAQVAMALVLLVGSGLMIRTFQSLRAVQPGFTRPDELQTMRISIPASLVPEQERVARLQNDIVDKLAAIPGVTSVGFASVMPMEGLTPDWDCVVPEGKTYQADEVPPFRLFKSLSPNLLQTVGTRLVAGRAYTWTDLYDRRPVVLVSENLAREFWGTPSAAIGKRIRTLDVAPWREVIGVVEDVYDNGVHEPAPAAVYWPTMGESPYRAGHVVVDRTVTFAIRSAQAGTEGLLSQVRAAVWSANSSLPLASMRTMQEIYDRSMARTSFTLVMLAIAGAMALVLGVVGTYGVISYSVSQRTREIGIRLALGAQRGELKRMFLGHGLMLAASGMAIGLTAAVGLTRLMSSLLFGVSPLDAMTYVAVPCLLLTATMLASYVPARRAAAMDPAEALKAE
jgi:predicted permease